MNYVNFFKILANTYKYRRMCKGGTSTYIFVKTGRYEFGDIGRDLNQIRMIVDFKWCPGPESNRHGVSTEGF
jgi:hypothetical protein